MTRSALIGALLLVAPSLAHAEDRSVSIEAPLESTFGDPIDVLVIVKVRASDEAAVPEQSLDPFEILDRTATTETGADGSTKKRKK